MNYLFFNCSSLESMPDISKWNIFNNTEDNINNYKSFIDNRYNNILEHYDINILKKELSFINTNYDNDLHIGEFSLIMSDLIPNSIKIEEFIKIEKEYGAYSLEGIFAGNSSLKNLPDISKWNIKNTKSIGNLF